MLRQELLHALTPDGRPTVSCMSAAATMLCNSLASQLYVYVPTLPSMMVPTDHLLHSWSRAWSTNNIRAWLANTRFFTAFSSTLTSWSRVVPPAFIFLKASYSLASRCFSALHRNQQALHRFLNLSESVRQPVQPLFSSMLHMHCSAHIYLELNVTLTMWHPQHNRFEWYQCIVAHGCRWQPCVWRQCGGHAAA